MKILYRSEIGRSSRYIHFTARFTYDSSLGLECSQFGNSVLASKILHIDLRPVPVDPPDTSDVNVQAPGILINMYIW